MPGFKLWFERFANGWGEQHDTQVTIDWIKWGEISALLQQQVTTQRGHDVIGAWGVPEDQVIDHREIYEECERRFGPPMDGVLRESYNPRTQKYPRFLVQYAPNPVIYRKDLWDGIGMQPNSWDDVRYGGRKIKLYHDRPVAMDFGPNHDGALGLLGLMFAFGASVQNADSRPALKSKQTLEALKFAKALYDEAMTEATLTWTSVVDNNVPMLDGNGSLTLNSIALTRSTEKKTFPVGDRLALASTPEGPAGRWGAWVAGRGFGIWKFADNIDMAKQFLVDYIGASREALLTSEFFLLPTYPQTVPDIQTLLANDNRTVPPDKYEFLATAHKWTRFDSYPGHANPAWSEIYDAWLIPKMFGNAASGRMTPEEALTQADQEVRKIYDKWRALGKV